MTRRTTGRAGRSGRIPRCAKCGGADLSDPAPVRTSAHPNSSSVLVETPGAHFHDHNVQAVVCLDCGAVELSLSPATLAAFRTEAKPRPGSGSRREPDKSPGPPPRRR